jgi:hypothetical protein
MKQVGAAPAADLAGCASYQDHRSEFQFFSVGNVEKMIVPVMHRLDGELKSLFRMQRLRYDLHRESDSWLQKSDRRIGDSCMPSVHLVSDEEAPLVPAAPAATSSWMGWGYLAAGAVLVAVIGTWLVWFSASIQRQFQQEDIRASCQRVMPDTAERCYDTVVIQRGGVRR